MDPEIIERNGSFDVVVEVEKKNFLGESHPVSYTLETFGSCEEAQKWIDAVYEECCDEDSDEIESDIYYTSQEMADYYNTYDYDDYD